MKEVTVVEVMIIVETVTKVNIDIGSTGLVDNTTPVGLVSRDSRRSTIEPVGERSLEVLDDGGNELGVTKVIAL